LTAHGIKIGSMLGSAFEVVRELGSGGFGRVYEARQLSTGQRVAVKTLRVREDDSEDVVEKLTLRFRRELELCAQLSHPNIVRLFDSGRTEDGLVYAVFEHVPGRTLADVLATEGALRPEETFNLMSQVLDAISCAHQHGVIHRDLKPENVMVTETGARRNALILDFGIGVAAEDPRSPGMGRLTSRGEFLGTPAYSAPEQLQGRAPSVRSDIYAWGLMFLECWTGEPVMNGGSLPEILHKQFSTEPVAIPESLRGTALEDLLRGATQKDSELRDGSAAALLEQLQRCLREMPAFALPGQTRVPRLALGSLGAVDPEPETARWLSAARRGGPRPGRIWQVPLRRNLNFTGRDALLERIDRALLGDPLCAIFALHGLGGVGKTQLALEYTYRHAGRYALVAWLRAENPTALADDYARLAEALDLPEKDAREQRTRIDAARSWLETHGSWLLVFDNAQNPDAIRAYLTRGGAGHTLVTSRHPGWRGLAGGFAVEVLERSDAVQFLLRRTGEDDIDAAQQLSDELDCLPLALEEAAAYIESTGRPIASYLQLFRARQRDLLAAGSPPLDYPATVRGTWEISFAELERQEPAAAQLLLQCAFFAPDDIPLQLLREGGTCQDDLVFDHCVAALRRYSLVKLEEGALSVHRLVQIVARDRLSEAEREACARRALQTVEHAFPQSSFAGNLRPECERLLPHAQTVLQLAGDLPSCLESAARLLTRTGAYLATRGRRTLASEQLSRAQRIFEKLDHVDPEQLIRVLTNHALVLYSFGQLDSSIQRMEHALQLLEQTHGAHSPRLAASLVNLAAIQLSTDARDRALAHAERALQIVETASGPRHPMAGVARSMLARIFQDLGNVGRAWEQAQKALAIFADSEGLQHPFLCANLNHLGFVLMESGCFAEARACLDRALRIGEGAYGQDHVLVAVSLSARGALLHRMGELAEARQCYQRALTTGERNCISLHEDIALARTGLADLLREEGTLPLARAAAEHALASVKHTCGDTTRLEARSLGVLAEICRDERRLQEGVSHAERAVRTLERRFGVHPMLIRQCNVLGDLLRRAGDAARAEAELTRALQLAETFYGEHHFEIAQSLEGLAELAIEKGMPDRARICLLRALALREHRFGPAAPGVCALRARIAQLGEVLEET
jgi:tetratricopeptide (TPR) repeat protein